MIVTFNNNPYFWEAINESAPGYAGLSYEQKRRLVDEEVSILVQMFLGQLLLADMALYDVTIRFQTLWHVAPGGDAPWVLPLSDARELTDMESFIKSFIRDIDETIEFIQRFAPAIVARLLKGQKEEKPKRHESD